jgi:hypothetical protein
VIVNARYDFDIDPTWDDVRYFERLNPGALAGDSDGLKEPWKVQPMFLGSSEIFLCDTN